MPANQAARYSRHTAPSFIASKPGSNRGTRSVVGARLARESGGAVLQAYRVIVHCEQARLPQKSSNPLERGLPANQAARFCRHTAPSFIASKLGSNRNRRTRWSEACPRIRRRGLAGIPRHRSSRASPAPTGEHGLLWERCLPILPQAHRISRHPSQVDLLQTNNQRIHVFKRLLVHGRPGASFHIDLTLGIHLHRRAVDRVVP